MTETCMFCRGPHALKACPLLSNTQTYLNTFAPRVDAPPPEARPRASLAPTLFEQEFGPGAELVLQDVPDHPEVYTADEINLAWQLLGGMKKIKELDGDDRNLLDRLTHRLIEGRYPVATRPLPGHRSAESWPERHHEDDEGPPRDAGHYEDLITKGQVDPSDG